ncbi:MAG: metallophosphoesterase [Tissierellia bacterium]|nr:metallophosphoesterase [Tissierellia bacterium]
MMKAVFIVFVILSLYMIYENTIFRIHRITIKSDKIARDYRFVQISDFHMNSGISLKRLHQVIKNYHPDIIFITGDLIYRHTRDFTLLDQLFAGFNSPLYFVTGNHEYDNPRWNQLETILKKYSTIHIKKGYRKFNSELVIYGKDYSLPGGFEKREEETYHIFLVHDPYEYLYRMKDSFDLVLSGHTHGGQVRLPFLGGIIDNQFKFFPKYSKGLYPCRDGYLHIDSGLGSKGFLRFWNPVQITFIDLKARNKK